MTSMIGYLNDISKVNSYLYIGSADAFNKDKLREHGITLVINCAREVPLMNIPEVEVVKLEIDDLPSSRIDRFFEKCSDLIKTNRDRGNSTLVHCAAGVSRSACIVLAHLMRCHNMALKKAYNYLKLRRPVIRPNVGFFRQLIEFERRLFGVSSVMIIRSRQGLIPDVYAEELSSGLFYSPPFITPPSLANSFGFRKWR